MAGLSRVAVVIPTWYEAGAIGRVVREVLAQGVGEVIVSDGGSKDGTQAIARAGGATVVVDTQEDSDVAEGDEPDVKLTVIEPAPKPTPVGVGAEGGSGEGEEEPGSAASESQDGPAESE